MNYNYVDIIYINRVSNSVRNFKKKSDNLWNCSCPICGDSHKNKSKARMYFMRKGNGINVYCHNCGYTSSLSNFIKEINYDLYKEYLLERYKQNEKPWQPKGANWTPNNHVLFDPKPEKLNTDFNILFQRLDRLEDDNEAKTYIRSRLIPDKYLELLYYTDNLKKVGEYFPRYKDKIPEYNPRLLIPIYKKDKDVWGVSARALRESEYRYLNFYENEEDIIIYGLERHNKSVKTYVTEGPLDSLFLPNCLASLNANLIKVLPYVDARLTTFIFDNQPRNKEVCKQIKKAIDNSCNVVIWNSEFPFKDINDAILSGMKVEKILDIIENNKYNSLTALVKFDAWKKVNL